MQNLVELLLETINDLESLYSASPSPLLKKEIEWIAEEIVIQKQNRKVIIQK